MQSDSYQYVHSLQTILPHITTNRGFTCGKSGHISRNCRTQKQVIECFNCGGRGHIAQNCWSQGNAKEGTPTRQAGSAPSL